MTSEHYDFRAVEAKWQAYWAAHPPAGPAPGDTRPKFYVLCMYPYPSGNLHMGHVINYTIGDALVRQRLMTGAAVLSPMGWDSFGLPAENAAIRDGTPPAVYTQANIVTMRRQFDGMGWHYDWSRETRSHDPEFYRWTQWLFLALYKAGLAYKKKAPVNWCPSCATVLANEQVVSAKCERCGSPVEQRDLAQWFFKMSAYAQRLLDGHDRLAGHWPEDVIKKQRHWIGRSEGARLDFAVQATAWHTAAETISVFTTRPDTVFGVSFLSLAPEHPLVETLTAGLPQHAEVLAAAQRMRNQSALERAADTGDKQGVFTGRYAVHPFTGAAVPIWVANFALMTYGTGAVMGVPAHDQRDFEFAAKYGLPMRVVIAPDPAAPPDPASLTAAYTGPGRLVHSGPFDGLESQAAKVAIAKAATESGLGAATVNYKLRDWLLSRQRYWGTPIPIVYCSTCGEVPVPEDQLPVQLPADVEFRPTGESPLARCEAFVNTVCPRCGGPARRDTDTMDTFVDSSWYFLRYCSPTYRDGPFDRRAVEALMPVDQYIGGSEHSTMHLIYSRFLVMALHDLGLVSFQEPFERLFCQGMVCREAYHADYFDDPAGQAPPLRPEAVRTRVTDAVELYVRASDGQPVKLRRVWLRANQVRATLPDGRTVLADDLRGDDRPTALTRDSDGWPVQRIMAKMSKSKLNGVSPDDVIAQYGADTLRAYMLFEGPANEDLYYSEDRIKGAGGFLRDLWRVVTRDAPDLASPPAEFPPPGELSRPQRELLCAVHQTIGRVQQAYQGSFNFNAGIARMMELLRKDYARLAAEAGPVVRRGALETLVKLAAPVAPHLAEELWQTLGREPSVFAAAWPVADAALAQTDEIEIPIQVNGKLRGKLRVARQTPADELQRLAMLEIAPTLAGKTVKKLVIVPHRMINAVVG